MQTPILHDGRTDVVSPSPEGTYTIVAGDGGLSHSYNYGLSPQANAQYGWVMNPSNGHYYRLTRSLPWLQAEAQAVQWGGHLATINNRNEEVWLRETFGTQEFLWIGFNDIRIEGHWEWASGEPVTYTHWASGEPNNYCCPGVEEDAAIINWGAWEWVGGETYVPRYADSWNDQSSEWGYRGIVERETSPNCSFSVEPRSQQFDASGGIGTLTLTATPGCDWVVENAPDWAWGIDGPDDGNGIVLYMVAPNPTTQPRTATILFSGVTFTINQAGGVANCTYAIDSTVGYFSATGGSGAVGVTTQAQCGWNARSNASWITITSGNSGTGNGTVAYSVAANNDATERSDTITIGDKTYTVIQAAACFYSLSTSEQIFDSSGGIGSVSVIAQSDCGWSASSNADWITITAGNNGRGNATVSYAVAANSGSSSRIGAISVAGKSLSVIQAGLQDIGSTINFTALLYQPVIMEFTVFDNVPNLFVLLQWTSSWWRTLEIRKNGITLKSIEGRDDIAWQLPSPPPGRYQIRISGTGSGKLSVLTSLPELKIGEWTVGTILRSSGSAWYEIHVPPNQQMLSVAVETLGLYSTLEVYRGALYTSQRWSAYGDSANLQIQAPAAGTYYVCLTDSAWSMFGDFPRDHQIRADLNPIDTRPPRFPVITGFSPTRGGTSGVVTLTITGKGLNPNAGVWLTHSNGTRILAEKVTGSTGDKVLVAAFDFQGVSPGTALLTIENPDGNQASLQTPFTIEQAGSPQTWARIVGRTTIRTGREARYIIEYGNSGNVDAYAVPLWIAVPDSVNLRVDTSTWLGGGAGADSGIVTKANGVNLAALVVPFLPAGSRGEIHVFVTTDAPNFKMEAWTSPALLRLGESGQPVAVDLNQTLAALEANASGLSLLMDPDVLDCIKNLLKLLISLTPGSECLKAMGKTLIIPVELAVEYYSKTATLDKTLIKLFDLLISYLQCEFTGGIDVLDLASTILMNLGGVNTSLSCTKAATKLGLDQLLAQTVTSISPEDKYGPNGYDQPGSRGSQLNRFISNHAGIHYRVDFWNREDAPAPTQDVIITDQLDSDLDWSTLSFTEIGFLKWRVTLEGGPYFNVNVDLRPDKNLIVNVTGTFNRSSGDMRWEFHALDPITRQPPEDPMAGFLPPITDSGYEIGWVNYTIDPKAGLPTGTRIENQAFVKFDIDVFKPAPAGGPFINTIDAGAPTSRVGPLPGAQSCSGINLSWSGSDDSGGSGIRGYTIYVSDNGAPYSAWLVQTTATSAGYAGQTGHSYAFYSVAEDNVGNREQAPIQPDASIRITGAPTLSLTAQSFASIGGESGIGVWTSAGCPWTAASNASWITITSGSSNTGNGTVYYSVAPNTTTSARTDSITIDGQTFTVSQSGNSESCTFAISRLSQALGASGGTSSINVSAPAGCAWIATNMAPWAPITSGSSGSGNGVVNLLVSPNASLISRAVTVSIAGESFTVSQAGVGGTGVASIFYPRLANSQASAASPEEIEHTGIAVANLGNVSATLTFTAFTASGALISGSGITNPTTMELKAGEQIPIMDFQLFGSGLLAKDILGWIRVESEVSPIVGFYLFLNQNVAWLDGADASSKTVASFILPELEESGLTRIQIANPNYSPAALSFELMEAGGVTKGRVVRNVNANGFVAESVKDLFPGIALNKSDYLRVASTLNVVPLELLGDSTQYLEALTGQDALQGSTTLYAPQYAVGGPDWRTTLSVINLDPYAGWVSFTLRGNDGNPVGVSQSLPIAAGGKIHITDQRFFLDPGNNLMEGSVEIQSNGLRLAGSLVFSDPGQNRYASALPLVTTYPSPMVFSQVASDRECYTGIALLNPNNSDAAVTIEVFRKDGSLLASKGESIRAKGRICKVLTEYFPNLAGQEIRGGYIKITTGSAIAGYAVFGTTKVLSTIPPQVVR